MESTKCQLCTRLTDGLCGNNTDGLTLLNHAAGGQIAAITLHADAMLALTSEDGTNFNTLNRRGFNFGGHRLGDFLTGCNDELAGSGMDDVMNRHTSENALAKRRNDFIAILKGGADKTAECTAIFLGNDDIVRDIHQTTRQITGVGRLKGGISKTLTGTVGGDEVLQHGHTFLKV